MTWLAICAALACGLAGAPPAGAQISFPTLTSKAAVSWGYNGVGELGDGTHATRPLFGPVTLLGSGIVQVDAGCCYGLALRSDGTVWAWGVGGQLGDGTTEERQTPVQVRGLTGVIAVSAGLGHSLALRSDGTVWAFGENQYGQLGIGYTSMAQLTPVQVTGLTGITKISAGGNFSLALRSDGTVWGWGYGLDGELGHGAALNSVVPAKVIGLSQITSISAGIVSSLAVRTSSTGATSVWAWGANSDGEVGDGTTTERLAPVQVTGIHAPGIAGIAAGDEFALALGTDGSVWAWGSGAFGELGNGPVLLDFTRPIEPIKAGSGITQLAAGDVHVLALKSNGTVLAWGNNEYGALGDGSFAGSGPVQVKGLTNATQVAAGYDLSLALYVPPSVGAP